MESLLYALPVIGCAAMVLIMMKAVRGHKQRSEPERDIEITGLRARTAELERETR
ncbi:hypothetical protein [Glycomyces tenuis]|uniref:hypothetical protein n=1 Tax=Glycomyces tenuis TaxID=58116 RepID=UPI00041442BB|nr:hypothetical protein [Glycomyces tenuis]